MSKSKSLVLKGVAKTQGSKIILENINLSIPSSQFFALLGPSGCGKTTLLRLIAGLDQVSSGEIFLNGKELTHQETHKRPINIIFQNYALFPHLSVFDNIAYSLYIQKVDDEIIKKKALKLIHAFHLEDHIYKLPKELSGGQQQRVAIARAIISEPDILLLDEPLAALDAKLREKLLIELMELKNKLSTTFIYVTHDQDEALTLADKMAIMNHDGQIEQIGTPKEIYEFPNSLFVAKFVGNTNIFFGKIKNANNPTEFSVDGLKEFQISATNAPPSECNIMSIRPEKIFISKKKEDGFSNYLESTIESMVYYGRSTLYRTRLSNNQVVDVFEQNEEHFEQEILHVGDRVELYWQKENAYLLTR
jgi:spermidine/putrescine transport system ATP-binding protein